MLPLLVYLDFLNSVKTVRLEFSPIDKIMRIGMFTALNFSKTENKHSSKIHATQIFPESIIPP